jgi:hypothetical protein
VPEPRRPRRPDPPPLVTRDVLTVTVGTLVWVALLVAALLDRSRLARQGHEWWIAAAAVGAGLGLLGVGYCARRARRGRVPGPRSSSGPSPGASPGASSGSSSSSSSPASRDSS